MSKVAAMVMMAAAVLACAGCTTGMAGWVCDGISQVVSGGSTGEDGDDGGSGGEVVGGLTNGTAVAVLGGVTLSNRQAVAAAESAGGATGRAIVWQGAPVASAGEWTLVSNGVTCVAVVMTQTVVTASVTGTVTTFDHLVVTEVHDIYADWQMPPYTLNQESEGMWREETSGESFYLYWEDMEGFYVLMMNGMTTCSYSNTAPTGTFGPYGMTMATGTCVVAAGGVATNDLVGYAESAVCVTNVYPIARHLREEDAGFWPLFEIDVTATMVTENDGVQPAYDFVLQASTDNFASVCYVYASFGTSGAEQMLYGTGHWYEETGGDFGGLCLCVPVANSLYGLVQKPFEESLLSLGTGYMELHFAPPTWFVPSVRPAWMRPDNTDLLWRVKRFNEGSYRENCWRMIRPAEWRVRPVRDASWKRFAGWAE